MPKYINPYTDFGFKKLFGVRAVAETAREEALIEGEEKGRIEGRIERDIELITDFFQQGMAAQTISHLLKIPIEKVQ